MRLLEGPVDVAALPTLTLAAPEPSRGPRHPLGRLPRRTHPALRLDAPAIPSWPLQLRPRHLRVAHRAAVTLCAWAPVLLTALDGGVLRVGSLEALAREHADWAPLLDTLIAAAAPPLPAPRRVTVGRAAWTLVRASVVPPTA